MKCQILFSGKNKKNIFFFLETICMKCLILFFGKNKKNITDLSSAELAMRVVNVNITSFGVVTVKM